MTTLHMDVESLRALLTSMMTTQSDMVHLFLMLNTSINKTIGESGASWSGNSATEFKNEFTAWGNYFSALLDQLNTLSTHLQNEITEWDLMASKLS